MVTKEEKEYYDYMLNNGCGTPLYAMIILGMIFLLCSCSTKKHVEYVDREVVRYETKIQHDTLINNVHDSIYHTVFQKGDTVYDTKYVEKTKWRDKIVYRSDTVYRDSIQVQEMETTVEKQKILKWCYYSLAVCILFVIFAIVKVVRWVQWH